MQSHSSAGSCSKGAELCAAISSTTRNELWTVLSQTGNWERRKLDLDGDGLFSGPGEMDDTSTFSKANEWLTRDLDSTLGTTGNNYSLTHDAAGNMTSDGKDYKYVYDVFGRLVAVKNQSNALVAEYRYNGLGYRTGWHYDADADSDVDGSDPWYYFVYDERWPPVATFRGTDANPKERFTFHNAGANGYGGSSYIDLVVLRDRDANTDWVSTAGDGVLEERNYYCQNWRADVSVVTDDAGTPIEWIKYSAYGVPSSYSLADFNRDGVIDSDDYTAFYAALTGSGPGSSDADFDGDYGTDADIEAFGNAYAAASTGGKGVLSRSKTGNRIGYAGYQWDEAARVNHVRNRVYRPDLGKWTRRDPVGYKDSDNLYEYGTSSPIEEIDPLGLCAAGKCSSPETGVIVAWSTNEGVEWNVDGTGQGGLAPQAVAQSPCINWAKFTARPGPTGPCRTNLLDDLAACCASARGGMGIYAKSSCINKAYQRAASCMSNTYSSIDKCTMECFNQQILNGNLNCSGCESFGVHIGAIGVCISLQNPGVVIACLPILPIYCTACTVSVWDECNKGCGGRGVF